MNEYTKGVVAFTLAAVFSTLFVVAYRHVQLVGSLNTVVTGQCSVITEAAINKLKEQIRAEVKAEQMGSVETPK
jgi:hypothetical protein